MKVLLLHHNFQHIFGYISQSILYRCPLIKHLVRTALYRLKNENEDDAKCCDNHIIMKKMFKLIINYIHKYTFDIINTVRLRGRNLLRLIFPNKVTSCYSIHSDFMYCMLPSLMVQPNFGAGFIGLCHIIIIYKLS